MSRGLTQTHTTLSTNSTSDVSVLSTSFLMHCMQVPSGFVVVVVVGALVVVVSTIFESKDKGALLC